MTMTITQSRVSVPPHGEEPFDEVHLVRTSGCIPGGASDMFNQGPETVQDSGEDITVSCYLLEYIFVSLLDDDVWSGEYG